MVHSNSECEIVAFSSKSGEGLNDWLELILNSTDPGKHIVDIDYDRYAEGEAVLGWLNSTVILTGKNVNWDSFTRSFMKRMGSEFDSMSLNVGHVKTIIQIPHIATKDRKSRQPTGMIQ